VHFYITNAIFDVKDHQLSAGLVPQTSYPWTSLGGGASCSGAVCGVQKIP